MSIRQQVSLCGQWQFMLDPEDTGLQQQWFNGEQRFDKTVEVPGAWQAQGIGDNKYKYTALWKFEPCQIEKTSYFGTGWYRREIEIPESWDNKLIWLLIGASHPVAEFWIDGKMAAKHIGTGDEYRLNITDFVAPGNKHELIVRISEYPGETECRNVRNPLTDGFLHWGTTWSGLYRQVMLEATSSTLVNHFSVFPDIKKQQAKLKIEVSAYQQTSSPQLEVVVRDAGGNSVGESTRLLKDETGQFELCVKIKNMQLWSVDKPYLYSATVTVKNASGEILDQVTDRFGMREFMVDGDQILLNDDPIWLRGYGDHCIYPLSLSPTIDKNLIKKELSLAKEYGFNYIAFYCLPVREFFEVADELGFLIQMCPVLAPSLDKEFPADGSKAYMERSFIEKRIKQTINHPSLMICAVGGEVYNHNSNTIVIEEAHLLAEYAREIDPSRLIITVAGTDRISAERDKISDILEVAQSHTLSPAELDVYSKPAILHEYRWWSSFANPRLKSKYKNAAMNPYFLERAEQVAAEAGVAHLLDKFVENSEKLQALERKIGMESGRRSPGVNGYEIYLGKDTSWAIEGIWDDFLEPKNVSAKEMLQSNGETVLLMNRDYYYRNYWSGEKIVIELFLSHFGSRPLENARLQWQLTSSDAEILDRGEFSIDYFASYQTASLRKLKIRPKRVTGSTKTTLHVCLKTAFGEFSNEWNFWIFARDLLDKPGGKIARVGIPTSQYDFEFFQRADADSKLTDFDLVLTNVFNHNLLDYLKNGGRAILIAHGIFPSQAADFRSGIYNGLPDASSGTVVNEHPAIGNFPHEGWCDLQFFGLIENAPVFNLDKWPVKIEPIIRSINCYLKGTNKAYLCECKVGQGALLMTTFNIWGPRGIGSYSCEVENVYLIDQFLRYAMSDKFKPGVEMPLDFLEKIAKKSSNVKPLRAREDQSVAGQEGLM